MEIRATVNVKSHRLEWASSKTLQRISTKEDVEKRELSHTIGGNINGYNHGGEAYGGSLKNSMQNYQIQE